MSSVIEEIKAKIDVVDEISTTVVLQHSGKSLKGLCPFHSERTPSFYVFRETQTWHCFGCNEGGDLFSFVQRQQGIDFRETLKYLAEKAGVALVEANERSSEEREQSLAKERLFTLNDEAALWFHQLLLHSQRAEHARAYTSQRGITAETIQAFSLGYASEQWDGLTTYLRGRGYTEEELVHGGLARWREWGEDGGEKSAGEVFVGHDGVYDYFRNRLMFPIRDIRGKVIGFGGRALGGGKPKYLNSPQTLLFEKTRVLYAIDRAKDVIKQVGQVVIVEGYIDAVIAHQYGTQQTVACIGSAITGKHVQQIKKLTKQVTLALDPDAAGSAATEQGIQEALKGFDRTIVPVPLAASRAEVSNNGRQRKRSQPQGIIRLEEQVDAEINVLQLPVGEDPDEVIRKDFPSWLYAVTHPVPLVDYYFAVKTADLNIRESIGKSEAAKRLLPVIDMIRDRIKRDDYVRKLAKMIRVDERLLYAELSRYQQTRGVIAEWSGKNDATLVSEKGRVSQRERVQSFADEEGFTQTEGKPEEATRQIRVGSGRGLDKSRDSALKLEDYLIGLLLRNPALSPYVCGIITDGDFAGTDTRELYHILNSVYQRDASPSLQPFEKFVPSALLPTVTRVIKYVELKSPEDGVSLVKEAIKCATRLKRNRLLQRNIELQYLIQDAAETGDSTGQRQWCQELLHVHRQLRTIDTSMQLHG
jgi:DNA primase